MLRYKIKAMIRVQIWEWRRTGERLPWVIVPLCSPLTYLVPSDVFFTHFIKLNTQP